jgi:transmembrane protein TMEM220
MAPVSRWFKLPCWVMAALFAVYVALQYNDPDPIRWMLIYGAAMVISVLLPMKRQASLAGYAVGALALIWAAILVYGIWGKVSLSDVVEKMSEKGGAVEEEREAGGLLIEGVWLVLASFYRSRRS